MTDSREPISRSAGCDSSLVLRAGGERALRVEDGFIAFKGFDGTYLQVRASSISVYCLANDTMPVKGTPPRESVVISFTVFDHQYVIVDPTAADWYEFENAVRNMR